ncbi:DUF4412 domain-containing protein [Algoriphagus marincola]|uniref:DUF4412 domain-containing protein n=1 Tax=Algoriphagus marincola TaxID=264027 RepID=A0ABS7N0T2_9BACT|nr:DUF4412 domain-containing protein [Algoriphagus marincola]MBY5949939.1 DUF4412 domain-containing protein [Algoriphagus marincola]
MNFKKLIFSLFLVVGLGFSTEAQILKKLKQAAERGATNALEKKTEEEINKLVQRQIEKQLSAWGSNESSPINMDMESIFAGIGEPVDIEDSYEFSGYMTMEIVSTDAKGKTEDPVTMKTLMTDQEYTAMEISDPEANEGLMTIVFDFKNSASVLFMDNEGQKSSFAYKFDMSKIADEDMDEQVEDYDVSFEKTGNTKTILGYTCDEYVVKSEDGEGHYWITQEPIEGVRSLWSMDSPLLKNATKEKYAKRFANLPYGDFMEMSFTETGGDTIDMTVIEIEKNSPKSLTTSEYPNVMESMGKD